jgi:hypothetical protein
MRLFNIVFVGLMATVAACSATDDANKDSQEPVTTDSDTSTTGNTTSLQCEELCLDGLECHHISGREIHNKETVPCVDWSQESVAKGCLSNDMGCGDAETYAAPSDDPSDCWWFPSTCVPTGWGACENIMMVSECDDI